MDANYHDIPYLNFTTSLNSNGILQWFKHAQESRFVPQDFAAKFQIPKLNIFFYKEHI